MSRLTDTLSVGELAIASRNIVGWTSLFLRSDGSRVFGGIVSSLRKGDIALIVDVFPPKIEDNEHVILVLTPRGIGWTWRGYFDRL